MSEDLRAAYERRKADKVKSPRSLNWKEGLALTISMLALILSGLTTYMNVVRTSDHIGLVVETVPGIFWGSGNEFKVSGEDLDIVFINQGGRPAAVSAVSLILYQPLNDSSQDDIGCWLAALGATSGNIKDDKYRGVLLETDFVPQIIKANEVSTAHMKLLSKNAALPLHPSNIAIPPKSGGSDPYFSVNVCLSILFSTPASYSLEHKVVRRWIASKKSDNIGFAVGLRGSSLQQKPIELYRRTGNIFTD